MSLARRLRSGPEWTQERLVAVIAAYCVATGNSLWWSALGAGREFGAPSTWLFLGATALALIALHSALMLLPATRWTIRPWLTLLVVATQAAAYYMGAYHVLVDASMLRNVLATDVREARELINLAMLGHVVAWSLPAIALIWWVRPIRKPLRQASLQRVGAILGALAIAGAALWPISQDIVPLMRNQRALRYLITPGNIIVGLVGVGAQNAQAAQHDREIVGADAKLRVTARDRPRVLVLVIGETARAANFQLDGYPRQTNPELSRLNIVNFPRVTACGTSTEVSLPCMFSPWGRADYSETRIRNAEGLLHVASRAGYDVIWLDNQSGCKGVCEGGTIRQHKIDSRDAPDQCRGDECYDMALVQELDRVLATINHDTVIVLHMIGNHGPAYFRRYPEEFRRFTPDCRTEELGRCSRTEIVNAFDNDIFYTDHVLASTIRLLESRAEHADSAMLYLSDHGESLGEAGLYLHGLPYAIAPSTQTHVPMIYWQSDSFAGRTGLDGRCLRARAALPYSHDNLFHSVLGLLDVETQDRQPRRDLFEPCRTPASGPRTIAAATARAPMSASGTSR
jgi:lipid A ethanolaminephosphotransferase